RAGDYVVEAAPPADASAPAVSGEELLGMSADTKHDFICPPKVRRFGLVVTPDGHQVAAGYQVTAPPMPDNLITTPTAFPTPPGTAGLSHLVADPGPYRFEVIPTPEAGLPRKIVQLDLGDAAGESALPTIQISPPLSAVGTVCGRPSGKCLTTDPVVAGA